MRGKVNYNRVIKKKKKKKGSPDHVDDGPAFETGEADKL